MSSEQGKWISGGERASERASGSSGLVAAGPPTSRDAGPHARYPIRAAAPPFRARTSTHRSSSVTLSSVCVSALRAAAARQISRRLYFKKKLVEVASHASKQQPQPLPKQIAKWLTYSSGTATVRFKHTASYYNGQKWQFHFEHGGSEGGLNGGRSCSRAILRRQNGRHLRLLFMLALGQKCSDACAFPISFRAAQKVTAHG